MTTREQTKRLFSELPELEELAEALNELLRSNGIKPEDRPLVTRIRLATALIRGEFEEIP